MANYMVIQRFMKIPSATRLPEDLGVRFEWHVLFGARHSALKKWLVTLISPVLLLLILTQTIKTLYEPDWTQVRSPTEPRPFWQYLLFGWQYLMAYFLITA